MNQGQQLDLLDAAPELVGIGGISIGKSLRRLIEGGIVTVSQNGQGKLKVTATKGGKDFLVVLRAHRLTI